MRGIFWPVSFWGKPLLHVVSKSNSSIVLDRPWDVQEVQAPRFRDNRYMKVVRLSVLRTSRPYPEGNIPGAHFCYTLSRPQGHSAARRNMSMKNYVTTEIEPANFRLVAQCLDRLRHLVRSSVIRIYLQLQRVKPVTNCCGCPKTGDIKRTEHMITSARQQMRIWLELPS
jgi:hypothetical protein